MLGRCTIACTILVYFFRLYKTRKKLLTVILNFHDFNRMVREERGILGKKKTFVYQNIKEKKKSKLNKSAF